MIATDIMRDMLYTKSTMVTQKITQGPDSKIKQNVTNTTFTTKSSRIMSRNWQKKKAGIMYQSQMIVASPRKKIKTIGKPRSK